MINIPYKSLLPQHVYIPLREHPTLCVFHFVSVPLWESRFYTSFHLYPTPMIYPTPISHAYTPLLYPTPCVPLRVPFPCSTPCVIHTVCFTPCVPSSLCAAPKVWAMNSTSQSGYPLMYCVKGLIWEFDHFICADLQIWCAHAIVCRWLFDNIKFGNLTYVTPDSRYVCIVHVHTRYWK